MTESPAVVFVVRISLSNTMFPPHAPVRIAGPVGSSKLVSAIRTTKYNFFIDSTEIHDKHGRDRWYCFMEAHLLKKNSTAPRQYLLKL